jgi:hypothetical protein
MQSQPIEWHTWHPHKTGEKKERSFSYWIHRSAIFALWRTPSVSSRGMDVRYTRRATDDDRDHTSVLKKKGSGKEVLFSGLLSRMWPTWLRFPSVMRLDCANHAQNGTIPLEALNKKKRGWASKNKISKLKFENPCFRLGSSSS